MKYLIRINKLKEKNDIFKTELKKIDDIVYNLELIKKNSTWTGEGSKIFFMTYDNYCDEIKKMERELVSTINYFDKYYDSYDAEFDKFKKKFGKGEVEIDDKND